MTVRRITATRKTPSGYVTHVDCEDQPGVLVAAADAILDIEVGQCTYVVSWPTRRATVMHVTDAGGGYLRADLDDSPRNNLLDLPDC
ncbi:DUF3892 domain-containing protein [Subtercola sp. YIM 133946]|uniref:DUF3892 domain-containing protein n=1 Tax=Subtercola sp. YIM 133946 TaxID=3118909 RepID=UPI002F94F7A3